MRHHLSRKRLQATILLLAFPFVSFATDLKIGDTSVIPNSNAIVPVTISNDTNNLSLVTIVFTQPAELPAPTVIVGADQPNILTGDCFIDDLGGNTYQLTALIRQGADMALGLGNSFNLQYNLNAVPSGIYPVTILSTSFHTTSNAEEIVTSSIGGSIKVAPPVVIGDYWLIQ
jgi:hypothetical protein